MDSNFLPMDPIIKELFSIGGQAGVLCVALYFALKTLKAQYEARICALEKRSDMCEEDRQNLHGQIQALQSDRITLLESLLKQDKPES